MSNKFEQIIMKAFVNKKYDFFVYKFSEKEGMELSLEAYAMLANLKKNDKRKYDELKSFLNKSQLVPMSPEERMLLEKHYPCYKRAV